MVQYCNGTWVIPEGVGSVNRVFLSLIFLLCRRPPACGRVEVGGGVKERPQGAAKRPEVLDADAGRARCSCGVPEVGLTL